MKIIAWDDRRFERDAQDIGLIMNHYLDAGNQDRVYSDQGDCIYSMKTSTMTKPARECWDATLADC